MVLLFIVALFAAAALVMFLRSSAGKSFVSRHILDNAAASATTPPRSRLLPDVIVGLREKGLITRPLAQPPRAQPKRNMAVGGDWNQYRGNVHLSTTIGEETTRSGLGADELMLLRSKNMSRERRAVEGGYAGLFKTTRAWADEELNALTGRVWWDPHGN